MVDYSQWKKVKKQKKDGKEGTQVMPVLHKETATTVATKLADELGPLAKHLFVTKWLQEQLNLLIKNIPDNSVVLNMDFAENNACVGQLEVQSAHG